MSHTGDIKPLLQARLYHHLYTYLIYLPQSNQLSQLSTTKSAYPDRFVETCLLPFKRTLSELSSSQVVRSSTSPLTRKIYEGQPDQFFMSETRNQGDQERTPIASDVYDFTQFFKDAFEWQEKGKNVLEAIDTALRDDDYNLDQMDEEVNGWQNNFPKLKDVCSDLLANHRDIDALEATLRQVFIDQIKKKDVVWKWERREEKVQELKARIVYTQADQQADDLLKKYLAEGTVLPDVQVQLPNGWSSLSPTEKITYLTEESKDIRNDLMKADQSDKAWPWGDQWIQFNQSVYASLLNYADLRYHAEEFVDELINELKEKLKKNPKLPTQEADAQVQGIILLNRFKDEVKHGFIREMEVKMKESISLHLSYVKRRDQLGSNNLDDSMNVQNCFESKQSQ
jgi:hypothetical protein